MTNPGPPAAGDSRRTSDAGRDGPGPFNRRWAMRLILWCWWELILGDPWAARAVYARPDVALEEFCDAVDLG